MRLVTQFIFLILALLFTTFASVITLDYYLLNATLKEQQYNWIHMLSDTISESLANDIIELNQLELKDVLSNIALENERIDYAFITDFNGDLLSHSFHKDFPPSLMPLIDTANNPSKPVGLSDLLENSFAVPIIPGMRATLFIGINTEADKHLFQRHRTLFALLVFSTAFIGLVLSIWIGRRITRPLQKLTDNITRYKNTGTTLRHFSKQGSKEVRQLTQQFDQMVTERETVNQATKQFKKTLDQTLDCIFIFQKSDLRFTYLNRGAIQQVGYSQEELLDMHPFDIKPEFSKIQFEQLIAPLVKQEVNVLNFETVHRHKDGHTIPVEVFLQYFSDPPQRFLSIVRDISERKTIERELVAHRDHLEELVLARTRESVTQRHQAEKASAAKSEFLSRMSHELRTPLNAIIGFGDLMKTDTESPLNDLQKDNLDEIQIASKQLLELVNEVLDLSRIESGRLEVSVEPVELAALVELCITQCHPLATKNQINLDMTVDKSITLMADYSRLRQVILNLLSNAVKYNRDGGSVLVYSEFTRENLVRVNVKDTGRGIEAQAQSRLFQPFERLETAYQGIEGSGIGLALVKKLVEAMGGKVGVITQLNKGSVFWFELPAAK